MEIDDFKPKQPTDEPQFERATAVKEAVVNKIEEAPVVEEVTVEKEPVLTIEGISPAELVESLVELKDRAKAAGLRPLQNVIASYASTILGAVDGLLEALEDKKKKGK